MLIVRYISLLQGNTLTEYRRFVQYRGLKSKLASQLIRSEHSQTLLRENIHQKPDDYRLCPKRELLKQSKTLAPPRISLL